MKKDQVDACVGSCVFTVLLGVLFALGTALLYLATAKL